MMKWIDEYLSSIDSRIRVTYDGLYYEATIVISGESLGSLSQDEDDRDEWVQHDGDEFTNPKGWVEWLSEHLTTENKIT